MRARSLVLVVVVAAVLAAIWRLAAPGVPRGVEVAPDVASPPSPGASVTAPAELTGDEPDRGATRAPAPLPEGSGAAADLGLTVFVHDAGSERGRAGVQVLFADVDLLPEMRAFDELVEEVGLGATTDASGRAHLPTPVGEFLLVARTADRFGRASRRDLDPGTSTVRVALFPDPELEVRVREASGDPARDVRVGLVSRQTGHQGWLEEWSTSDADGRLVLHPGRTRGKPLLVHALIESPGPVEVALDDAILPVTVTLPPCGRVDLSVEDADGRPEPREFPVHVQFAEDDSLPVDLGLAGIRRLSDGRATLPRVVAGSPFQVRVGAVLSEVVTLQPAEVRSIRLTHAIGSRVTVRLLDPHGTPLAHALIRSLPHGPGPSIAAVPGEVMRCDAEGRLGLEHGERDANSRVERTLASAGRLREPLTGRLEYQVMPGTLDLGDLRLVPEPLLVGGVVVDAAGEPVAGADVTCGLILPGGRDPIWRPDWTAITDAHGRFAIHSSASAAELRLAVDRPGHVPVRDLAVAPGTGDLRVVLARGSTTGSIVGRVRFENVLDLFEGVQVLARPVGGETLYDGALHPWSGPDFEIPRLPPGTYEVEVRWNLGGVTRALHTIRPVRVKAGPPTRDPRLESLDLRDALQRVRLTVVGPDGEGLREVSLTFLDPLAATAAGGSGGLELGTIRRRSTDGTFPLLLPTVPLDLEVRAEGCAPQRLAVTGDSLRVDLRRPPR